MVRRSQHGQTLIEFLIVTMAVGGIFLGAATLGTTAMKANGKYRFAVKKIGRRP